MRGTRKAPLPCHCPTLGVPDALAHALPCASVSLQCQAGGGGGGPAPRCSCRGGCLRDPGWGPELLPGPAAAPAPPLEGMLPAPAPQAATAVYPGPPSCPPTAPPVPFGEGRSSCPPRHPGDVRDGVPRDTASCSPRGEGSWLERVCSPPPPPPPGTGSGQALAACGVGGRRRRWWRVCGAAAGSSGSCAGGSRSCPQMSPCPQGAAELNAARAAAPASPHAGQTRATSLLGAAWDCRRPARHRPHAVHMVANAPRS